MTLGQVILLIKIRMTKLTTKILNLMVMVLIVKMVTKTKGDVFIGSLVITVKEDMVITLSMVVDTDIMMIDMASMEVHIMDIVVGMDITVADTDTEVITDVMVAMVENTIHITEVDTVTRVAGMDPRHSSQ